MVTPPAERGARYQSPEVERLPSSAAFLTLRSATLPPWEGGRELGACASLRGCRLGVLCLKSRGTDTLALLDPSIHVYQEVLGIRAKQLGPSPGVSPRPQLFHGLLQSILRCLGLQNASQMNEWVVWLRWAEVDSLSKARLR